VKGMGSLRGWCSVIHGIIQRLRSCLAFLACLLHHPKLVHKLHSLLQFHCSKVLNYKEQNSEEALMRFHGSQVRKSDEYVQRVFSLFDRDADGFINSEDIRHILENLGLEHDMGITPEFIGFDEFLGVYNRLWDTDECDGGDVEEENENENGGGLMEVFNVFDKDGDGYICASELQQILNSLGLKEGGDISVCESMISKVDINFDGKVDFNEFKHMMLFI
ncbi:hypothetical protein KI387_011411, partial [Taxus chinensis]